MSEPKRIPIEQGPRLPSGRRVEVLVDSDWDLPCDVGSCTDLATWIFMCAECCPQAVKAFLLCVDDAEFMLRQPLVICVHCGTPYSPPSTAFTSIERLNPLGGTAR